MISWSNLQTITQDLVSDTTAGVLDDLKRYLNVGIRDVRTMFKGSFVLEDEFAITTVASTQWSDLPIDLLKVKWAKLTISSTDYYVEEEQDYERWAELNRVSTYTSTIPQCFYVKYTAGRPRIGLFPIPASAGTLTLTYIFDPADLSVDDVSLTAASFTNGDATVGHAAGFTAAMVDDKRWLLPAVATGGDGHWYRMLTFTTTSSIELAKNYEGLTDTSVSATVAQLPLLPLNTHILPAYFAAEMYFLKKRNIGMADRMESLYRRGIVSNGGIWNQKGTSQVRHHNRFRRMSEIDPNIPPRNLAST